MNRIDLALGYADVYWGDSADAAWIASHGRALRRRARLNAAGALRAQSIPITERIRGWRRYGASRGFAFSVWSPWIVDLRAQLHLAVLRGSESAARQLAQALVDDVTEAA
jgi:hypothetical protein